jgi:hypothetical protein
VYKFILKPIKIDYDYEITRICSGLAR